MARCVFVVFVIMAMAIVSIKADKSCDCDLRFRQHKLHHFQGANLLTVLKDLPDPSYKQASCEKVLLNCPKDCRKNAHKWMGGNAFTLKSGQLACEGVRLNAPPSKKIYVYATYDPDYCGGRMWQYLGPLCCWKVHTHGYSPVYFNNRFCKQSKPPTCSAPKLVDKFSVLAS